VNYDTLFLHGTKADQIQWVADSLSLSLLCMSCLHTDNCGDINESRMMRMGGDFTVMMRVAAPKTVSHPS